MKGKSGTNQLLAVALMLILAIRESWPALLSLANEILVVGQAMSLMMFYCTFWGALVTALVMALFHSTSGPHNY
jgi:hypothetical protein